MVSQNVFNLCQATETVSSALAKDPSQSPGDIVKQLYRNNEHNKSTNQNTPPASPPNEAVSAVETAFQCGRWGPTVPSQLFLQAFADALQCLDKDPMAGVVSPPLMGTHGTMPLTVIAPLADIMRHTANLIVRAQREVFLITCSWAPSVAQRLIKSALIELSRRAGQRGERVVVKVMYDKATAANVKNPHQHVREKSYTSNSVDLPAPGEIPNIDMEVVSLHKYVLGTLHAKFCVVDRTAAAVMSNNTEDNDNLEMMIHVEGPIVDSIYDTALITWNMALNPQLLLCDSPPTSENGAHSPTQSPASQDVTVTQDEVPATDTALQEHTPEDPHYDDDMAGEVRRMQASYEDKDHESLLQAANRKLNVAAPNKVEPTGPEIQHGEEMTPYILNDDPKPVPMALVSRAPYGPMDTKNVKVPQNEAWLSLMRNAQRSIFIQTPDLNAAPLIPALIEAVKRGVEVTYYVCFGYNDPGEMMPGQGGTNDQISQLLVSSLPEGSPERERLHIYNYIGKDQDHPIHQSFKSRSCHIKLLIVDGSVGIQGSGNQDTQSWFHSQEINVMVDSPEICQMWRQTIDRNQNTKKFGKVAEDGIWRDKDGNPARGYMGNPGTVMGFVKGAAGMISKWKNTGGF
ncbi:hypothetical protein FIE12Z_1257 [Fusarium flagelliforme]|uniref:PLD phosphodiesterase domain-containing protein n=1 Tax=Fusarium flagelliforme TaxID=2675880 RepID=A0A395N4E9_9HYPO|nr:hypothetical protein FIE12Z_1257 [Fusarium flagelliforme]